MAVSSLFDSALQVVLREVTHYERGFPYLPGNVRTRLARVMAKRGLLHRGNMPLVLHDGVLDLDLSECVLTPAELHMLWALCPQLRRVDLGLRRGCRNTLPSPALSQFFSHCRRLHVLSLQSCTLLDHSSLAVLASSCPLLSSLSLTGCHMVSDRGVAAIAQKCCNLQVLGLARTKVSSDGLIALSRGVCANVIKELDISHCLNVTDEGVAALTTHCPRLSILVFHSCPLVTRNITSGARLKQVTWTVY